jgi:hypothetical protein
MTAVGRRPGAAIAVAIALTGWSASVIIRTWRGMQVDVAAEGTAVMLAAAALYAKMSGRGSGPDDGAA